MPSLSLQSQTTILPITAPLPGERVLERGVTIAEPAAVDPAAPRAAVAELAPDEALLAALHSRFPNLPSSSMTKNLPLFMHGAYLRRPVLALHPFLATTPKLMLPVSALFNFQGSD
jgi:hypothetical protein